MPAVRILCALALASAMSAATSAQASPDGTWRFAAHLPSANLNTSGVTMVHDPVRQRILLLGDANPGVSRAMLWALPTSAGGQWTMLPTPGAPTSDFLHVQACYDAAHDQLAVWEGFTRRLWTVSLNGGGEWTSRTIDGPSPRLSAPACAYDPVHGRMILFGGYDGTSVRADVWALPLDGTSSWTLLAPSGTGPTGRMNPVALVDPAGDRLIVHGGRDFTGPMTPRGDVWALSLSGTPQWTALFTADSTADRRWFGHAAVLDAARQRMLVFGGEGSTTGPTYAHAEVAAFALDGSNAWSVAVPPDPERGAIDWGDFAAFDPAQDVVFEYGIRLGTTHYETRRLSLSPDPAWSLVAPARPWPPARVGQASAYDPIRDRWLSYGGRNSYYVLHDIYSASFDDLWSFRPDSAPDWEELPANGARPPGRELGAMVYDPIGDRMILFGGNHTYGFNPRLHPLGYTNWYGDTWSLALSDPPAWTQLATDAQGPGPRDGHVMVLDALRHRVLMFGGRDSLGPRNDLWSLPLDGTPAWTPIIPTGARPAPRGQAVGAYDAAGDRLVIACGYGPGGALLDAWQLRLDAPILAWEPLVTAGSPPTTGPYSRPYAFDPARRRVLALGTGEDLAYPARTDVWALTLAEPATWSLLALEDGAPAARCGAAAGFDVVNDRLAFLAGGSGLQALNPRSDHWLVEFPAGPIAVGPDPAASGLMLGVPFPNPARASASVWFELPAAGAASLELFDVTGRRIEQHAVGSLGAGRHSVTLGRRTPLAPGLYFARLSRAGEVRTRRLIAIR